MVVDFYHSERPNEKDSGVSDDSYDHDKGNHNVHHDHAPGPDRSHYQPAIYERPKGFKGFYQHPTTQVCLLGLTCFMCPGLYNALNGLGQNGQDSKTPANANAAIYATFAFASFFAGSVNNKLGSKRTLILGSLAYPLYIGSYLALDIHPNADGFVIGGGAILGVCAGLLWSAQGSLMLAYPVESEKGLYIGIFWSIFNLGGVVGAAVSFGENFQLKGNHVANGTYIIFLVLTLTGVLIPLIMTDPNKMIRTDGTRVTTPRHPSWKVEFYFLWVALRTDPFILLLFPLFFTSNWFYTWQFNDYNGALFNIRTRSLNNFCYWLSQIVGSLAIGLLLDQKRLTRRARAFLGWIVLFVMVFAVHTWAYIYQRGYTRATEPLSTTDDTGKMDFLDPHYPPRLCLYILCGLLDAMWQTAAYWMMGAMSNDPAKLAYFTGFYKSLQSAGAAGIWRADAVNLPYMSIFASTWALLVAGLVFALPMLYLRVHDTTTFEEEVLARMDDHGHVQSITDYQTRSISDSEFTMRERHSRRRYSGHGNDDDDNNNNINAQLQLQGIEDGVGVGFRHVSSNGLERPRLSGNLSDSIQYAGRRYHHDEENLEDEDYDEKTEELSEDYEGTDYDDGDDGEGGEDGRTDDDIEKARRTWKVQINHHHKSMPEGSRTRRSWSEPAVIQRDQTIQLEAGYSNNKQRSPPSYRPHPRPQEQQQFQRVILTPPRLPEPALRRLHSSDGADDIDGSSRGSSHWHHANNAATTTVRYPAPDDYRVQRSKQDWNQSNIDNWREKYREGDSIR